MKKVLIIFLCILGLGLGFYAIYRDKGKEVIGVKPDKSERVYLYDDQDLDITMIKMLIELKSENDSLRSVIGRSHD